MNSEVVEISESGEPQAKADFKNTPLGWIPDDWEINDLGEIAKIHVGRDLKEINFSPVQDEIFKYPVFSNTVENEGLYGYYNIAEYNGESLTIVGRGAGLGTSFTRSNGFGAIGRLLVLFPKEGNVAYYIAEYINSRINIFIESGGIPQLTGEQIAGYKIALPKPREQRAIANVLKTWDDAIGKTQQIILLKERRKKWLMHQLLTGKKRLAGFSGEWQDVRLGDVFTFLKTESYSRECLTYDIEPDSIYYIHYGDLHTVFKRETLNFKKQSRVPVLKESIAVKEENFLKDGDLIISDASEDYAGIGQSVELINIGDRKVVGGLHTFALRDEKGFTEAGFRAYLLKSPDVANSIKTLATGISVLGISKGNLSKVELRLPLLKEQAAIANILQAADREIDFLKEKLELLKTQKKGLMQQLLTGRKRLKGVLKEEQMEIF